MRIENYEILKCNQWCYQVYRVLPDDFDNSKAKYRQSPLDERFLKPLECFPNTLPAAIRRCIEFCERDGLDTLRFEETLAAVEKLHESMSKLADEMGDIKNAQQ